MNYLYTKISMAISIMVLSCVSASAASITIDAPSNVSSNRQPVVVRVFLDPEQDTLSGIAGNFSFSSDLFTIADISTENSVVSLWAVQPSLSEEKYLDARTHISFEGAFPGGYGGVRSPYYKGALPGILFSITLIPKGTGEGTLIIDDLALNAFDKDATPLPALSVLKDITVPQLNQAIPKDELPPTSVTSPTLTAVITRDELVNRNAWYLLINDPEPKSSIAQIYVAETDDYNGELVEEGSWRAAKNPYVLLYQNRTKYVHAKIVYSNRTYTIKTLPPVENSPQTIPMSRILVSIVIALSLCYLYGKKLFKILYNYIQRKK
jgi:hypothetical protein